MMPLAKLRNRYRINAGSRAALCLSALLLTTASSAAFPAASTSGCNLPRYANWNTGSMPGGYSPDLQVDLIKQGYAISPWLALLKPGSDMPISYYQDALLYFRKQGLPVTFVSTQWEYLLSEDPYFSRPDAENANVVRGGRKIEKNLSPFGAKSSWYETGRRWAQRPLLKTLAEIYPDPPAIRFLSNNEHPKLRWFELNKDLRFENYRAKQSSKTTASEMAITKWTELYRALQQGMRDGLPTQHWRDHARFIGFVGDGSWSIGRDSGWRHNALVDENGYPAQQKMWDGASFPVYFNSVDTLFRIDPLIVQNAIPYLAGIHDQSPDFDVEISVWDGFNPNGSNFRPVLKKLPETDEVQSLVSLSTLAMWTVHPSIVREFRFYDDTYQSSLKQSLALARMVTAVGENEILRRFWCQGDLVRNDSRSHPFNVDLPKYMAEASRWFLLDTADDTVLDWIGRRTPAWYVTALEVGEKPAREWLLLGYGKSREPREVDVKIPSYQKVRIKLSSKSRYYWVKESGNTVALISP